MKIKLSPIRVDEQLIACVNGDVIILNGTEIDLSPLSDGAILPAAAIDSQWLVGDILRVGQEIHLTLALPHGPNAPHETRFPAAFYEPMTVTDGPVPLPPYDVEPDVDTVSPLDEEPGVVP